MTSSKVSPPGLDPLPPASSGEVGAEVGRPAVTTQPCFTSTETKNNNNNIYNNNTRSAPSSQRKARKQDHRCKAASLSKMWSACITEHVNRKDPRFHEQPAQDAVQAEFNNLDSRGTWDWDEVMEAGAAKRLHPDGHFARCFPIIGLKNGECSDRSEWVWKG